jgi:peptidoglycan hydrolase-like protein with peptidoglycan-binding domain
MKRLVVSIVMTAIALLLAGSNGFALPSRETAPPAPRFVREAQQTLRELGYKPGPVDGVVGPRTKSALAQYQRAERIKVTGQLDSETMARLDIQERVLRPTRG